MPRPESSGGASRAFTLALVITVVAVLYLARDILLPFALAVLLSFLLAPLVKRLEILRLGRVPAVAIVMGGVLVVVFGVGWIVASQTIDVVQTLPRYRDNIQIKFDALRAPGMRAMGKLEKTVHEVNEALSEPAKGLPPNKEETSDGSDEDSQRPVPVRIVGSPLSPWPMLTSWLSPTFALLANAGVVVLFAIFMLLEREDLRNRLIRLIGPHQIHLTTQALDDAATRVSKYLRMQLIVNASYGCVLGAGLYLIGVPNAALWGMMAALLRYIPYVGPWVAAAGPIVLSLAVFNSWTPPLLTFGLVIVLELVSNNVVEPVLYRSSTGISTLGILVAAVFWTWLWGAVGLVLATPLTVCIAVMGRYVPQLGFLNTLLSDEPVLSPGARFYQRLLADDEHEAEELVDKYLAEGTLDKVYNDVLLPALALVAQDRHRGLLDEPKYSFILDCVRALVDDLPDRAAVDAPVAESPPVPADSSSQRLTICLPARDEADELAAQMLSQLLTRHGRRAETMSVKALASEMLDQVERDEAGTVYVSALPPMAVIHARYLCKRLRTRFPQLKIVVGMWEATGQDRKGIDRLRAGVDKTVSSLSEAIDER